jgi:microcystin-dependent protein
MAGAQFTIPLVTVIPGQIIASALWNNEFLNLSTNLNPLGLDGYEDTDTQMQIQTAPYPGSVTSHASSLGGEIERIRYQISAMLGATTPAYWYAAPPTNLTAVANQLIPIGGVIDFPSATPPNANFLLANGQAIGRVQYASLFTLIGTTFGIGDGSTTFNIPNYTDRMSIAAGNIYSLGGTGGATTHTLTNSEIPHNSYTVTDPGHNHTDAGHSHGVTDPSHTHTVNTGSSAGAGTLNGPGSVGAATRTTNSSATGISINTGNASINSNTTGISVSDSNSGGSHNILNPYLAMYKLIRVL